MRWTRRCFLTIAAAAPLGAAGAKPMRGIFPILQTPFSDSNKVENDILAKQVQFMDRCGVHGMVWPQLASEYMTLSREERLSGAEAILAAGRGIRPAVVIGVQADDAKQAIEYARHATRMGADALIALPPRGVTQRDAIGEYYQAVGKASDLPLFVQAIGDMPVEFVIDLARRVPTLRMIKDEAGPVLERFEVFREKAPYLAAFSGGHGKTLYDEMTRGFAGSMPAAGFADLYAASWDAYQAGNRRRSAELSAYADLLVAEIDAYGLEIVKYMLHVRGVFRGWATRNRLSDPNTGRGKQSGIDANARRAVRELLEHFRPHLRA